jgi:DNA end-binding protein Ku
LIEMPTHTSHRQRTKRDAPSRRGSPGRAAKEDDAEDEDGTRAIWTGSIAFGLVQIGVRLRTAERSKQLSFHQLDKRDHSRIRYERVNEGTKKRVAWTDIVKGYEVSPGKLVVVDDEDFEKANVEATHTIDIQDFVVASEIAVEHFERPYYLVPEKNGKRAYAVLRDVLAKKGLVAIALVVIRTRQRLCAILPQGDALVLVIMRFGDEIVPLSSVQSALPTETKVTPKELALAEQLVDSLTTKWNPAHYEDTYTRDLLAAIEEKSEKGTVSGRPDVHRGRSRGNVVDLVALLQKSVARSGDKRRAKPTREKRHVRAA